MTKITALVMMNIYSNRPIGNQARMNDILAYSSYEGRDDIEFRVVPLILDEGHDSPDEDHIVLHEPSSRIDLLRNTFQAIRNHRADVDIVHFTSLQWYLLCHFLFGSRGNTVVGPNIGPPIPTSLRDTETIRFFQEHYPTQHLKDTHIRDRMTRWKLKTIDRVLNGSVRFIQCGQWPAEATLIERGIPEDRVSVFPPSVRTDIFYPRSSPRNQARRELLVVTSASKPLLKGFQILVDAVKQFEPSLSDVTIHVLGLGGWPDEKITGYESVRETFEFHGRIPREDLRKQYCSADALINPSYTEADGGTVMSEALACGTPVIATRGDAFETAALGNNTLFFERGNPDALAKAVNRFYRTPNRYWTAAREQVDAYDIESAYDVLVDTYERVLGRDK
ncbi:glycosyltransferase family 4 protein [Halosimplex amylolyticum]|uniref:glycosyltransferase family 4 protein n=1 Tax=Halosimplex amylolyticum TaxID=3396616 RepID=UPI003F557C7E